MTVVDESKDWGVASTESGESIASVESVTESERGTRNPTVAKTFVGDFLCSCPVCVRRMGRRQYQFFETTTVTKVLHF